MRIDRRSFLAAGVRGCAGGAMLLMVPKELIRAAEFEGTYLERAVCAMGTTVSISAFGESRSHLIEATTAAFTELYRLERLLSVFRPDSDISRLNAAAGRKNVTVSPETREVLSWGKRMHARTAGAFDVTVESLARRFGFRELAVSPPDADGGSRVGDQFLHLHDDGTALIDVDGVGVDTGGIGVGYAVDRMASVLRARGIRTALINHGGDIYAMGAPQDAEGWDVVVPHPSDPHESLAHLYLRDKAVSTSSNTKNTRDCDGKRIGHIFDPRTGENPSRCLSMTVLAGTCLEADALSTAFFVAGTVPPAPESDTDFIALYPQERLQTSIR